MNEKKNENNNIYEIKSDKNIQIGKHKAKTKEINSNNKNLLYNMILNNTQYAMLIASHHYITFNILTIYEQHSLKSNQSMMIFDLNKSRFCVCV